MACQPLHAGQERISDESGLHGKRIGWIFLERAKAEIASFLFLKSGQCKRARAEAK